MRIAVVGTGYVGLVTGVCLAEWGHMVICVDKNPATIEQLKLGNLPMYEPGLEALLERNMREGRISFSTDTTGAVADVDAAFIAVGTPTGHAGGEAELSFVFQAAKEIAAGARPGLVVVDKSTVPVGTGDEVEALIASIRGDQSIAVVSNPEFLREGSAIKDFMEPDRVVIGAESAAAEQVLREIYALVAAAGRPVVTTTRRTSELIKYASNAFLATKIGLINELADLCEATGADVTELAVAVGLDHRIGSEFLRAGPGFGGSCFPKDTKALLHTAHSYATPLRIIEAVVAANNSRKHRMVHKVREALGGSVQGAKVAVLGLTFKANTDDVREAPSIPLIKALQREGAKVVAYDPQGAAHARLYLPDLIVAADPYACAEGADAIVVMTEWDALSELDLPRLRRVMRRPTIVDLRNVYPPNLVATMGFYLVGIGRPKGKLPPPPAAAVARAEHELAP